MAVASLGHVKSSRLVGIGQDNGELLTAIAGGGIARPLQGVLQTTRDGLDAFVAARMVVDIVKRLEPIDVEQQETEPGLIACAPGQFLVQSIVERPAVENTGQAVDPRQPIELFVEPYKRRFRRLHRGDVREDDQGTALSREAGARIEPSPVPEPDLAVAFDIERSGDPLDP